MRPDIVHLRQFYAQALGRKVRKRLRRHVREYWQHEHALHMVGVGYTTDLLPLPTMPLHADSRIVALMPSDQGAIYWPINGKNHSALGDVLAPPFMPSSLHRVLMLHMFEYDEKPDELLRIWWQLLAPGGRLMVMVPNRHGLWARYGASPYRQGTAYTLHELKTLFNTVGYTVRDCRTALYALPSQHPLWLRLFMAMEALGSLFLPRLGGVIILEAEKQIYAGVKAPVVDALAPRKWAPAQAVGAPKHNRAPD